ncbi:MAG TPA: RNA polymerase sigma factor [Mycobacteriales bacterium]|nr:RNA polymerase sigma factor [Mycobacteriales bacterium]
MTTSVEFTAAADPQPRFATVFHLDAPGEAHVFEDALRRAVPRLYRYALRRLGDPGDSEEVVQEALLRAYQHRKAFATEDDLMAWVTVVTGRLVIDRVRVRSRSTPVADLPATTRVGRDTADVVVARDEARTALDALEAMPSRQAAVLWAREVEGLSYDQIAQRHGMTEPSVRSVLHRARIALRKEYAARGGSLPAGGLVVLAPWLHGLRGLARLRAAARRSVAAPGALAVTTLAVAGIVGLSIPNGTGLSTPGFGVPQHSRNAVVSTTLSSVRGDAARPSASRPAPATPAFSATGPAGEPTTVTPPLLGCQRASNGDQVGVDCAAHHNPVLYLGPKLPFVPRYGVSNSVIPCTKVPTTPVTYCDTGGTNGQARTASPATVTPTTPGAQS